MITGGGFEPDTPRHLCGLAGGWGVSPKLLPLLSPPQRIFKKNFFVFIHSPKSCRNLDRCKILCYADYGHSRPSVYAQVSDQKSGVSPGCMGCGSHLAHVLAEGGKRATAPFIFSLPMGHFLAHGAQFWAVPWLPHVSSSFLRSGLTISIVIGGGRAHVN